MKKAAVFLVVVLLLFGGTLFAQGNTGSIVRIIGDIEVPEGDVVTGDVVSIIGKVVINGEVTGNVVSIIGGIEVGNNGLIQGNVVSILGRMELAEDSRIDGNQVSLIGGGLGQGIRFQLDRWELPRVSWRHHSPLHNPLGKTTSLAWGIVVATLIALAFPTVVTRMGENLQKNPARVLLLGLLSWTAGILLVIAFAITLIGIPVSLILVLALVVANWFGRAAVALLLGQAVLKNNDNLAGVTALGALLLGAVNFVPLVGGLVSFLVSLVALGMVVDNTLSGSSFSA